MQLYVRRRFHKCVGGCQKEAYQLPQAYVRSQPDFSWEKGYNSQIRKRKALMSTLVNM